MFKILIVHGWYHSKRRYEKLQRDLQCQIPHCCCDVVDLPGFGEAIFQGELSQVEEIQVNFLRNLLEKVGYHLVIAHSWGARLLLQSLPREDVVCILLNPAYGENTYLKAFPKHQKLAEHFFQMGKTLPPAISTVPIKLASFPSVNRFDQMDEILLEDVRCADPHVSGEIARILATKPFFTNKNKVKNPIYLFYSDKDRVIPPTCFQALQQDLCPTTVLFPGVGHTLVLEDYDNLRKKLVETIKNL